jgi:hypothetical protein
VRTTLSSYLFPPPNTRMTQNILASLEAAIRASTRCRSSMTLPPAWTLLAKSEILELDDRPPRPNDVAATTTARGFSDGRNILCVPSDANRPEDDGEREGGEATVL